MQFNFDKIPQRRGTNSVKWDLHKKENLIPLWVADMDFEVPSFIKDVLIKRVEHGVFGYSFAEDSYYQSVINWFSTKHNWHIKKEEIIPVSALVPAIYACLQAICKESDKVIVQCPVYNQFFDCINNSKCILDNNQLIHCTKNGDESYEMNFIEFEEKCKDAKCFILCNPHNPAGRVWTQEELEKVAQICKKHNVTIISDEIHCELVMGDNKFTPMATIAKKYQLDCISLNSPTKNFNIPGLQIANIICDNLEIRKEIIKISNKISLSSLNPFGIIALQACYSDMGEAWLKELNHYILENYNLLKTNLSELEACKVYKLEGSYLAWIDCREVGMNDNDICKRLMEEDNILLNSGSMYGEEGFLRFNLATSKSIIETASQALKEGLKKIITK